MRFAYAAESPKVSTHSRPKAAGKVYKSVPIKRGVSTHSRPKAAVTRAAYQFTLSVVSTHSRPKAADGLQV